MNMRKFRLVSRFHSKIDKLGFIWFVNNLAFAFVGSVFAIYLNTFLNNESHVGLVFTLMTIIAIFANILIIPIIESKSKARIFTYSCFLIGVGYIMYSVVNNVWVFIGIACMISILTTLKIASGGLLVEHLSDKKTLSKNEGLIYTFLNLAWVLGPLIVGFMLEIADVIRNIFILAAICIFISVMMMGFFKINYSGARKKIDGKLLKNIKEYISNKNRVKNYFLSAGITLWWALIFVYMPLLIVRNLSDYNVGFFLFFAMLPLILLQYYFGKWVGKYGYRKIFMIGFLIPAVISIFAFFFMSNIWIIMALMCISSIGLAITEGTTEAYFFDILKAKEDQKFYSLYNTSVEFGALIGNFIPAMILMLLPFDYLFLFFGACMFVLFIVSTSIKDIVEFKRKGKFK